MCSKHVEARNKLTVKQKFCASSWLITEIKIKTIPSGNKHNCRQERGCCNKHTVSGRNMKKEETTWRSQMLQYLGKRQEADEKSSNQTAWNYGSE